MLLAGLLVSLILARTILARTNENATRSLDYEPDVEPYEESVPTEKPIFNYLRNGVRVDIRAIPVVNDSLETDLEDRFPDFPIWDIGRCVIKLSLTCTGRSITLYLETIKSLDEITLFGQGVKLVRTRVLDPKIEDRKLDVSDNVTDAIERSIDGFFDTFALRITLPGSTGRKERNQIDVALDETGLIQGRGKKGKGDKGGGKCKKMMMMMLVMVKMKMMGMIGMTAMKGMMMAGMSLMISKFMLIQKLLSLKKGGGSGGGGGPWQAGGGGGGGGGGGQLKEIVLVTKASGGGGGCCGGGGGAPMDSYGAPPSNSYGPPSGGAGGYDIGGGGGGGGWGRSLDDRSPTVIHERIKSISNKNRTVLADAAAVPAALIYNIAELRATKSNSSLDLTSNPNSFRYDRSLLRKQRLSQKIDENPTSSDPVNPLFNNHKTNSTAERQTITSVTR